MPNYRNSINGSIAANAGTVVLPYRQFSNGAIGVQITGTFSGTLQFEMTIDGTNYVAVQTQSVTTGTISTTTTTTGVFRFEAVGALAVRLNATAWTSGTATVTLVGLDG